MTAAGGGTGDSGVDVDPSGALAALERLLRASPVVAPLLADGPHRALPGWYVAGGAVAQAVWNAAHGFAPAHGIRDVDLVYFDPADLRARTEQATEDRVRRALATRGLTVRLDVTNEARVHLWYEARFGRPLAPYTSTEHAIATWPTTAASVGVRIGDDGHLVVCAPFGLDDLFGLVVRPNRVLVTEEVYTAKAARWRATWPRLHVVAW